MSPVNVILFSISVLLVGYSGWSLIAFFQLNSRVDRTIAFMIVVCGQIVLSTTILSELRLVSSGGYLGLHGLIAVAARAATVRWSSNRRRDGAIGGAQVRPESGRTAAGIVVLFFVVIVASMTINLYLALAVPTNVYDSMTQHLSRVGYWLQHRSLEHFYTQNHLQNSFPPNAEILILWPVVFLKSDLLANAVQWLAAIGTSLVIYRTATLLGSGGRPAQAAALTYLSLPMVMLQSTSTYNDLVITFFAVSCFSFFHSALRGGSTGGLVLSGIACGLAVGAKYTMIILGPGLVIASLTLVAVLRAPWQVFARWVALCLSGVLLFGGYNYYLNFRDFGHPIAPQSEDQTVAADLTFNPGKGVVNAGRYLFEAVDLRGLPVPVAERWSRHKQALGERYLSGLGEKGRFSVVDFNFSTPLIYFDTVGWFGVLGFLLFIPAALWIVLTGLFRKSRREVWGYGIIAFSFFLFFCFLQDYTPYKSRYFVLPMAFVAPLVAVTFFGLRGVCQVAVLALALVAGTVTAYGATFRNISKPVLGAVNVFNTDRVVQRGAFGHRSQIIPFLRFIEECTSPRDRIGHVVGGDSWDYPMFGSDFSRIVIPVKPAELRSMGADRVMDAHHLDFLVLEEQDASAAYRSEEPAFLAAGYWGRQNYYVVTARAGWEAVIDRALMASSSVPDAIGRQLDIFGSTWNASMPLRVLLARSSTYLGDVSVGGVPYVFSSGAPLVMPSLDSRACSILVPPCVGGVVRINGRFAAPTAAVGPLTFNSRYRTALVPVSASGTFTGTVEIERPRTATEAWDRIILRGPEHSPEGTFSDVSAAVGEAPSGPFVVDLLGGEGVVFKGIYGAEGGGAVWTRWRWTNGAAEIRFPLQRPQQAMELRILTQRPPVRPRSVALRLNGHLLSRPRFARNGTVLLRYRLEPTWFVTNGLQILRIDNEPLQPSVANTGSDMRHLGIRLFGVTLASAGDRRGVPSAGR